MNTIVKLKIADVIIKMQSKFGLEPLSVKEKKSQVEERFRNFLYSGKQKPYINIEVDVVNKLPIVSGVRKVFVTYHFQDGNENWRLLKKDDTYFYKCPLDSKKQLMIVNASFNKVKAYLLPKRNKGLVWNYTDLIYDFLQVLLINYFAQRKSGVIVHSVGIKDLNGEGLIFAGKSGAGKSTTARLWDKHSKVMILNDDRIIVRKINEKFVMYGCPWHGEFSDYLASRLESACLKKLVFIRHAPKNVVRQITPKEAFNLLYPALFPPFWDKGHLENTVSFCQDLVKNVDCYSMGFVNDKKVINFVGGIDTAKSQKAAKARKNGN